MNQIELRNLDQPFAPERSISQSNFWTAQGTADSIRQSQGEIHGSVGINNPTKRYFFLFFYQTTGKMFEKNFFLQLTVCFHLWTQQQTHATIFTNSLVDDGTNRIQYPKTVVCPILFKCYEIILKSCCGICCLSRMSQKKMETIQQFKRRKFCIAAV